MSRSHVGIHAIRTEGECRNSASGVTIQRAISLKLQSRRDIACTNKRSHVDR